MVAAEQGSKRCYSMDTHVTGYDEFIPQIYLQSITDTDISCWFAVLNVYATDL